MSENRYHYPDALVSTDWLQANLANPDLRLFDCTTHLAYETGTGRPYSVVSGRADYDAGHIPGSAFLDVQERLSETDSPYAFTLLSPAQLAIAFAQAGIGDCTRVVLYARDRMQWATRVWWTLRAVGFDNAAILDGGWFKWLDEIRPVATDPVTYPPAQFTPQPRPAMFVGKETVAAAIGDPGTCTVNALEPDLHSGANARYGRPGRIPGSVNVPATSLVGPHGQAFAAPDAAAAAFAAAGASPEKRVIVYCGGGIAATLDAFLLHQLGYRDIAVYDASMSEWAKDESLPIETD